MGLTFLKWVVIVSLVVVIALALLGKKRFYVETVIGAPPSAVWAVLMDTDKYAEWNPVFVEVKGPYQQGGKVANKVRDPEGKILEMTARVETLIDEKTLQQKGGIFGFITFDHQWILEPVAEGTKVIQHEIDRGFYVWFWDSSWIESSYLQVNKALEKRVLDIGN